MYAQGGGMWRGLQAGLCPGMCETLCIHPQAPTRKGPQKPVRFPCQEIVQPPFILRDY